MREVKFRVWSIYSEKMFDDGFYLSLDGDLFQNDELDYKNRSSFEIMQFTGLKDKNGVDIYEGDIVEHYMDGEKHQGCEVVFEDGMFCFKYDSPNPIWLYNYHEVIGNIYENPELR